ncbi:MAG: trypsin-like peptidase domain-containing protein [Planctomycetes bacterium]|nr:trypsin-like peptidase domain-containing protein [Planctomycetota bacterium]
MTAPKFPSPLLLTLLLGLGSPAAAGPLWLAQDTPQEGQLRSRSAPVAGMEPEPGEQNLRMTPVVRAVQRAADSVVSIYVGHANRIARNGGTEIDGQGSGVILDETGMVITNWHVVAPVEALGADARVQVRLKSGKTYEGQVLSTSPKDDLALLLLRLPAGEKVKPVTLGNSDTLMDGETLIAIGNPQGHANTVTVGVLSSTSRSIAVRTPDGQVRRYSGLLQTDAAINQGNSGGALLDLTGKLVGVNNAMAVGAENIGFAIPVNTMRQVFRDVLLASENLSGLWVGMKVQDQEGGPVVAEVHPHGPAAAAGLRRGDRIAALRGQPVATQLDYARLLASARVEERLPLRVLRNGKVLEVETAPMSRVAGELLQRTGMELEEVTPENDRARLRQVTRKFYEFQGVTRYRELPGVLRIRRVAPDSPADQLRLRAGDIVLPQAVHSPFGLRVRTFHNQQVLLDFVRAHAGEAMPVEILRGEDVLEGRLQVPAS